MLGQPEVVLDGLRYPEAPLWSPAGHCLYFVEWLGDRVWRLHNSRAEVLWATRAGEGPCGLAQDGEGCLWACLYSARQVVCWSPSGETLVVFDGCGGERFKGPNDLVLDGRGGLYVTDSGDFQDDWTTGRPAGAVYYLDAAGLVQRVASALCFPNGIALAAGGTRLIVAEHRRNRLLYYPIRPDATLVEPDGVCDLDGSCILPAEVAHELGPDGMCWDDRGRLWVAHHGGGKLLAVDGAGKQQGTVVLPHGSRPTNVAFDPEQRVLYVTECELGLLYRVGLE